MDSVVQSIVNACGGKIPSQLIVFLVSMIPILELRGSILAAGILQRLEFEGIDFLSTYICAVLGNMLPIPFVLLFLNKILEWMKGTKHLGKFALALEKRTLSKRDQIDKYGFFGLYIFVAIPLPGTGAWTGSMLATLLEMKFWKSLLAILLGVMTAGLVMSLIAFGLIGHV